MMGMMMEMMQKMMLMQSQPTESTND